MRSAIPLAAWVAAGSALGAAARWGLGLVLHGPSGTLTANLAGAFLIGLYAALTAPEGRLAASPAQRQFVMAGLCGGFTTFSLFSAELLEAALHGSLGAAALWLGVSVVSWLLGVWLGHTLGQRINRLPSGGPESL